MSDTRPYPKILRTTESADHALREYAARTHLAPFEALILAIGLLRTKDEREAASERAYKFASLWHDIARKLWHRWRSGLWAIAREQNAADGLRREVASAREATRRADAEVERLTREVAKLGALKSAEIAPVIERFKSAFGADIPQAPSGRAATQPCACALPALPTKLGKRAAALAKARAEPLPDLVTYCVALGVSRLESLARHAPVQAARDKAKRAAAKGA